VAAPTRVHRRAAEHDASAIPQGQATGNFFRRARRLDAAPPDGIDYDHDHLGKEKLVMQTARLFTNGRSQAVRLPKECRLSGEDVYVRKLGGVVLLIPMDDPWASLVGSLDRFSDDFMEERVQPPTRARKALK
jgi:antitoxin VapB